MAEDEDVYAHDFTVPDEDDYIRRQKRRHFGKGFITGAVCALALIAIAFVSWHLVSPESFDSLKAALSSDNNVATVVRPQARQAAPAVKIPKPAKAAEKVKQEETIEPVDNKETANVPTEPSAGHPGLGHPDRIRPGTKIKVPSAETLGIDPEDPAVVKRAKKRGAQIYSKYKKN